MNDKYLGKVKLTNGTLTTICGKGSIQILHSLTLSSILHVATLSSNFLSVNSLTKNLNSCVTLFPTHYVIQDLRTRTLIGGANKEKELYVFHSRNPEKFIGNCIIVNEEDKYKWHYRLRHPSDSFFKTLFSSMFKNGDNLCLDCDNCMLSKHHCSVYPHRNRKFNSMFSIVYSDVWSLAPNTPTGYRYHVTFIDDVSRMTWVYLLKSRDGVLYLC